MTVTLDELREANRNSFAEKMDEVGITDEKLIEVLWEELQATETKVFHKNEAGIVYSKELIAHEPRLRALDIALRLKGSYPVEKKHHTFEGGVPILPLTKEQEAELALYKKKQLEDLDKETL